MVNIPEILCKMASSAAKIGKGVKRKQRFRAEYTAEWPFIVASKKGEIHVAHCIYCNAEFSICHGGKSDISQHLKTRAHATNSQRVCEQKSITKFFASGSDDAKKDSVTNAECLMTHFIIEHNLPVSVADHMTHLFPKMFPDSKIANNFACKRTKTTHIIHETASDKVSVLKETLTRTVFSLATDGSSDQGASESLYPVLVRYFNSDVGRIVTALLSLPACDGPSTGENIFNLLDDEIENWDLCIGFCSDNANVMAGSKKGVTAFIKQKNPDIFASGCTCHLLHLAASHAAKELPVKLDDILIDIYYYLDKSVKRKKALSELQQLHSDEVHKILKHCATRWLSLELCIKRLLEQYEALSAFFKLESATKTPRKKSGAKKRKLPHGFEATSTNPGGAKATSTNPEGAKADSSKAPSVAETDVDNKSTPVSKASTVNERLQDPRTKLYGLFLGHTLPVFNKFNLKLQSDEPQIHNVRSSCIDLLTNLLLRLIKPDVISSCKDITTIKYTDRKNQKSRDDLVIGAETRRYLEKCKKDETMTPEQRTEFFNAVRGYYAVAIKYILDKFPIQDDLLIHAEVADPSKRNSAKFQSLKYFTSRFPRLLQPEAEGDTDDLMNKLEMQFLLYQVAELPASLESLKRVDEVWSQLQQDSQYTLLSSVMLGILTLPHSNADSERVFSVVRKNQTVFRPNASRKLLESVLVVKSDSFARGSACYEQTFDAAFLRKAKSATYVGLRDADDDVAAAVNVLPNVLRNL